MKILYRILLALHLIVGLGALAGGGAAILNPYTPLGVQAEVLKNSPFNDFLIPGIILFAVIGIGNIIGALAIILKSRYQGYISCIFGGALVIWIIVQCVMLWAIHALHVIFFTLGAIEAALAVIIMFKQRLFPTNYILSYYNKINRQI